MATWQTIRSHRYYCEADLVLFEVHGDFTLPDVQGMYAVIDPILQKYGYVLLAFDAYDSGTLTAEARRYVGDRNRNNTAEGGTVIIGASFTIRTLIQLLRNAGRLFGVRPPPLFFCATTEEALRWLDAQRLRYQTPRGR